MRSGGPASNCVEKGGACQIKRMLNLSNHMNVCVFVGRGLRYISNANPNPNPKRRGDTVHLKRDRVRQ